MALKGGTRLGPYEIIGALGSGGMGEVYRARDERLSRDVAIKLLPQALSGDPDRLRRFEREARATAALSHPGILAVFDVGLSNGSPYLVSELLEGETLRRRLASVVPVRKSVEYATQIARALAAAHERGIVHRDLKPENLFITTDGRAKILDFGLAKLVHGSDDHWPGDRRDGAESQSQTISSPALTEQGMVIGTTAYMAPEQARGQTVDHRADIFSFGAVLYEMLSGQRAFQGATAADTVAAILHRDPPELPLAERHIPPALARIVDRCLQKDPAARFGTAGDLAFALEGLSSSSDVGSTPVAGVARGARAGGRAAWAIAGMALAAAVGLGGGLMLRSAGPAPARAVLAIVAPAAAGAFALSPDGTHLVAESQQEESGGRVLWLRRLDESGGRVLAGTEGGTDPFWSPDGRSIGFFSGDTLKRVDLSGVLVQVVASTPDARGGGTWNREGVVLFGGPTGIMRVAAAGGKPEPVTLLDASRQESAHRHPSFLPDGRHFLYAVASPQPDSSGIFVGTLETKDRRRLVSSGLNAVFAPPDHVLFALAVQESEATLMTQRFDPVRIELESEPFPLADGVGVGTRSLAARFAASDNGILTYLPSTDPTPPVTRLSWYDRAGALLATVGDPGTYRNPRLSPDGSRIAVEGLDGSGNRDIWVLDARGAATRLTFDAQPDTSPVWSPDGSRIAWRRGDPATTFVFHKAATGVGTEEMVPIDPASWLLDDWPRSDALLVHSGMSTGAFGLRILPLTGGELQVIGRDRVQATHYRASPDGGWVAFGGDYSGSREIYVQHFPTPAGRWRVSTGGGLQPVWRRDSRELYYLAPDGTIMAAPLSLGQTAEAGVPVALFRTQVEGSGRSRPAIWHQYDVTPDGKRFLVNTLVDARLQDAPSQPSNLTVVVNWTMGLDK